MQKSNVTFRQLLQFRQTGMAFLQNGANMRTKMGYAIKKMLDKVPKLVQPVADVEAERNEKIGEAEIDFAETDAENALVYDITKDGQGAEVRHFKYTREGLQKYQKKRNELIKEYTPILEAKLDETVEIDAYFSTEVIPNLSEVDLEIFKGIVIDPAFVYPVSTIPNGISENGSKEQAKEEAKA